MARSSSVLASLAKGYSVDIFKLSDMKLLDTSHNNYNLANSIATRLYLISSYLESLPPYWIEPEIDQVSESILGDLRVMTRSGASTGTLLHSIRNLISSITISEDYVCLASNFKTKKNDVMRLYDNCDRLCRILTNLANGNDAEGLPDAVFQQADPDIGIGLRGGVFDAIQSIVECDPSVHNVSYTMETRRHPTRLCLYKHEHEHEHQYEDRSNQDQMTHSIVFMVSTMNMSVWQEFCLTTGQCDPDKQKQCLHHGDLCQLLERQLTARLYFSFDMGQGVSLLKDAGTLRHVLKEGGGHSLASVLHDYHLSPKDKILLACTITQAYWTYYDSEFMRTKWTSKTVWFMPEEDGDIHNDRLPLRAYLSFPFGIPASNTEPEFVYEDMLTHRCPRIFDIAVLLLEICLGTPFRPGKRADKVALANMNHKIANNMLDRLMRSKWDGFMGMEYVCTAIRFCLNGDNFLPKNTASKLGKQRHAHAVQETSQSDSQKADMRTRRLKFYRHVVLPLHWLQKQGFHAQDGDVTYVCRKAADDGQTRTATTAQLSPEPDAWFHTALVPRLWLHDLTKISCFVESKRRECRSKTSICIAILDTGLNREFPAFNDRREMLRSVIHERDFVSLDSTSTTMTDTFGHGTLMAGIIMECNPGAKIAVARVSEGTNKLEGRQRNIKEAILWAGQTVRADIISMSFGFRCDDPEIAEAIETVHRERKGEVIFMASAGNSSTDDESFPARHHEVISVYATDPDGVFLSSNPVSTGNGASLLGTYGSDLPDPMCNEFSAMYPGICQPGSSVATAVMAAVGAAMLSYASILPQLAFGGTDKVAQSESNIRRLWTTRGMERLLFAMAQPAPNSQNRAVKPIYFWKENRDFMAMHGAIQYALRKLETRNP